VKTCEDVLDLLPDALPWIRGEALEVYDHLKVCVDCSEAVEATAQTVEALCEHAEPAPALSAGFTDAVMAALPPAASPAPQAAPSPFGWGLRLAAAAALFCVGLGVGAHHASPVERVVVTPQNPVVPTRTARPTPVVRAAAPAVSTDPLGQYAAEAALVLQAVDSVETSDPEVLRLLAYHVQRTQLLDHGDRLLSELRGAELEPLINGTQLILRKVRHARADSAPHTLWTIREEVRQTGILDAYRQLLTADSQPTPSTTDPL
jgi:hypothetical protein